MTAEGADFKKIGETFDINPVLARLIVNRDIKDMDGIRKFLHGGVKEFLRAKII